jgi:D-amino peptidase
MRVNNVFIISDLEGAHSVERFSQTRRPGPALENARRLHTGQVNAVIRGIRAFDPAVGIHLWDSHGHGGIDRRLLDPVEKFIPPGGFHLLDYFKSRKIDALFFESAHAMSRTPRANLSHTMSSRTISRYILNGAEIGEIGLRAIVAGAAGVPVFYLNGDDKACGEARLHMPWIVTTETKKSVGLQEARHAPRDKVLEAIGRDVYKCLQAAGEMRTCFVSSPISLRIHYKWGFELLSILKMLITAGRKRNRRFQASDIEELVDKGVL